MGGAAEQVAVLVPLQIRDRVLLEERPELASHVGEGLRIRQVECLLMAPGLREFGIRGREHPVRVRTEHL